MRGLLPVGALAVAALLSPTAALAAEPRPTGVDLSFPNCRILPSGPDFAIVGVNGGVGTTTNPCFAEQRAWALTLPGAVHGRTDVYLNTQDPDPAAASWWPSGDATKRGRQVTSPYGRCLRTDRSSRACAWVYGASLAWDDLETRGLTGPVGRWWLDVEVANDWSTSAARNRAVLEGMTSALLRAKQKVGVYSPANEFPFLVGAVPTSSVLSALPSWISHAADQTHAERLCTSAPLTRGRLLLVQWHDPVANVDRDVACALLTTAKPTIAGHLAKGARLTAKPGRWGPGTVSHTYQWVRDGIPIVGAVHRTYRVQAADRRHRIAVVVTGTETGYSRAARPSAAHRIPA